MRESWGETGKEIRRTYRRRVKIGKRNKHEIIGDIIFPNFQCFFPNRFPVPREGEQKEESEGFALSKNLFHNGISVDFVCTSS